MVKPNVCDTFSFVDKVARSHNMDSIDASSSLSTSEKKKACIHMRENHYNTW